MLFEVDGGVLIEYVNSWLGATVIRDLREHLFAHLQSLPLVMYARERSGEALSRFSTDLAEVETAAREWISLGVSPALEILTAVALLFYLNWPLALAAMLIWPLSLAGPKLLSSKAVSATYEKKQHQAAALSIVQENVAAQPLIRVYGLSSVVRS